MEENELTLKTKHVVVYFLHEEIFVRLEIPWEIMIDEGTQFTSIIFRYMMDNHKIKNKVTKTCHPHANEQVEGTNKFFEETITKTTRLHHKD